MWVVSTVWEACDYLPGKCLYSAVKNPKKRTFFSKSIKAKYAFFSIFQHLHKPDRREARDYAAERSAMEIRRRKGRV
jgi:hypothetical protein